MKLPLNNNPSFGPTSQLVGVLLFSFVLLSPLMPLPAPANVSSIPWKVELLFTIFFLAALFLFRSRLLIEFAPELRTTALLLSFFIGWSSISLIWSGSRFAATHHTLVWANYLALLLLAISFIHTTHGVALVIRAFACVTIILAVLCIFDYVTLVDFSVQEGPIRIRYAKYAELLAILSPVLFATVLYKRDPKRVAIAYMPAVLSWIAVMLSLSKGAFIAGAIGFIVFFVLAAAASQKGFRRRIVVAFVIWLAATITVQFGFTAFTSIPATTQYISGASDESRSTSTMRVFTWKVAAHMFSTNPMLGVGADNFGFAFNEARRSYSQEYPDDIDSAIGEDYIFERAHNEPLQILAELGIVGLVLYAGFVAYIIFVFARGIVTHNGRVSPMLVASVAGMTAFAVSSLFSSFSFRAYQNGIVFFLVLAIGLNEVLKKPIRQPLDWRPSVRAFAATAAILLAIYSLAKGGSQLLTYSASRESDFSVAASRLARASTLDSDNGAPELALAERHAFEKRWPDAVPHFQEALHRGLAVSLVYSYTANAEERAGDLEGAAATLQEGVNIFPRSTFLRARLAVVLEALESGTEAEKHMAIARSIDQRHANGWYEVIKNGVLAAHLRSRNDPKTAAPPELLPTNAIFAYADEPIGPATPQ